MAKTSTGQVGLHGNSAPQNGQRVARRETSLPHSRQVLRTRRFFMTAAPDCALINVNPMFRTSKGKHSPTDLNGQAIDDPR